ncbi:MAG: fasciclin domain-containing protein [Caldilineaceae bacterium]|nr:fasciclin domain-containing protein [Caldilineaceae bacterium]
MTLRNKLWQTMALIMVVAMLVSALPAMPVAAQATPIVSSSVRGELSEQFAKHYLELRVTNPSAQVRITMEVNPQDRQELDSRASFYVFDETGFSRLVNSGDTNNNLAVGALQTVGGVKQRVAVIANPVGGFTVVPFNDSNVPMDYTLTVENGVFVDGSGEQVTNALAAPQTVAQPVAAEATPTPAAATTTTVAATAAVTPTTVAAPAAATVVQVVSRVVRVAELEGELNERFAKHYFELETEDISRPVVLQMTYNPQDQQAVDNGLNFYVLTEDQFRAWTNTSQPNTAVGSMLSGTPKTKQATIQQPLRNYTVVVGNDSDIAADYTLTVQNAILIDESGQSTTAQALGATGVTTTTVVPGTTTAVTDTTTTAAATTTAAPAADAITPPTTYTVVRGDTMGTIARRAYGNIQLFQQLCAFNNIADCNRIEIGDQIQIPLQSQLGGTATTTTAAAAAPTPAPAAAPAATTVVTTTAPATTTTTTTTPANAGASGNLVATTGSLSVLDTLGLLLDLLELEQDQSNNVKAILQGGTYTFFAPTDTAFTSLDEATLESLIANPTQLANVLKAHIVPGQLRAANLTNGQSLQTLAGTSLPVTVSGNVVSVGNARVSQADVLATNGVIHIIDSVLVQ